LRTALLRPEANPAHEFDVLARAGLARSVAGIELSGPGAILDAGCGSGAGLQALADRWPAAHITGVDLPSVATTVRLPRPLRTRVVVRGAELTGPLEEHPTFDAALCHSVLHEVVNPDLLLRTLARSLRPGGQLSGASFTTAYYEQVWSRLDQAGAKPPQPGIRHRPDRIEAALWSAGFTNVETWTEDVAVQVSDQLERSYLQRVLGRPLEPGELDRLMDVVGRPLVLDLSPLHFRALASHR
jgi:SAM-dependent methyltransferase